MKTYHANLFKRYVERSEKDEVTSVGALGLAGVGIIEMDNSETEGILEVVLPPVKSKEGRKDVNLGDNLNSQPDNRGKKLKTYSNITKVS